ncbi:MAG TPA: hypothetical protein DE179_14805 [Oceanospirillaceae bacterium]|nr:hypothetical protein [Oceanospirillaceae bacterium]
MKKKDIDKELFKRVKNDQPNKAYDISDKSSRQLDRSETAEFVASQQRIVNTLGEESELAENWHRFSNAPKAGGDPAKRQRRMQVRNDLRKSRAGNASLAGSKARHASAVGLDGQDANTQSISNRQGQASLQGKGPVAAKHDVLQAEEGQAPASAGQAQLEGREETGPGQAWLEGSEEQTQAGYAQLHGDDSAEAKAGYASLDGQKSHTPDATAMANDGYQDPQAGFASLDGHQPAGPGHASLQGDAVVDPQAGEASLQGNAPREAGMASLQGDETAAPQAGEASLQGAAEGQASQDQLQGMSQEEWDRLHQAGNASLEGDKEAQAGQASLQGGAEKQAGNSMLQGEPEDIGRSAQMQANEPKTRQQILMEAKEKMRRHRANANLQGRDCVEQNVALQGIEHAAATMGQASLEGRADRGPDQAQLKAEESVERLQGQAILEGKLDSQDQVKLKGKLAKSISKVQLDGIKPVVATTNKLSAEPSPDAKPAAEKPTSRLASRLAQKMSKIREQSADISKESEELQHRNADD